MVGETMSHWVSSKMVNTASVIRAENKIKNKNHKFANSKKYKDKYLTPAILP